MGYVSFLFFSQHVTQPLYPSNFENMGTHPPVWVICYGVRNAHAPSTAVPRPSFLSRCRRGFVSHALSPVTEMSPEPAEHRPSRVPCTTYERRAKIRKLFPSIFEICVREGACAGS